MSRFPTELRRWRTASRMSQLRPVREALDTILDGHLPVPAMVMGPHGILVSANRAFELFHEASSPRCWRRRSTCSAHGPTTGRVALTCLGGGPYGGGVPVGRGRDLGALDGTYLRIVGRKKDLIVTSTGKNIAPKDMETRLRAEPFISQAIVIGDGRKYLTGPRAVVHEPAPA
jgi:acyl-CoA synthetase (AMP-forming)/AMP-acid ligase II